MNVDPNELANQHSLQIQLPKAQITSYHNPTIKLHHRPRTRQNTEANLSLQMPSDHFHKLSHQYRPEPRRDTQHCNTHHTCNVHHESSFNPFLHPVYTTVAHRLRLRRTTTNHNPIPHDEKKRLHVNNNLSRLTLPRDLG
jgi:hypothetical protein